jgi:hypothetical protein
VTCVVDCSIVIRLLANKPGDELLRQRLAQTVHDGKIAAAPGHTADIHRYPN